MPIRGYMEVAWPAKKDGFLPHTELGPVADTDGDITAVDVGTQSHKGIVIHRRTVARRFRIADEHVSVLSAVYRQRGWAKYKPRESEKASDTSDLDPAVFSSR